MALYFILFMRCKFLFCFKRMKAIQAIKVTITEVIPLSNVDIFFTARKCQPSLPSLGIIYRIIYFSQFELSWTYFWM